LLDQPAAILRGDGCDAQSGKAGPEAEKDIGVVDRPPAGIAGIEDHRRMFESPVELCDDVAVSARAPVRVPAPARPVQHQAPGAFEETAVLLVAGEIDHALDREAAPFEKLANLAEPLPLEPPRRRRHRIENQGSVGMGRHPVVGEYRVGLCRLGRVVEQQHLDTCVRELARQCLELGQGSLREFRVAGGAGEDIGACGLGVEAERRRADEKDGACGLRFHPDDVAAAAPDVNQSTILQLRDLPGVAISRKLPATLSRLPARRHNIASGLKPPAGRPVSGRSRRGREALRKLGIIGGTSWASTALYYEHINRGIARRLGGLHSACLVIESLDLGPVAAMELSGDWDGVAAVMTETAKRLVKSGAEGLLIASNTGHKLYNAVASAAAVPVLHIGDAAADQLIADSRSRVALLGTRFTMTESHVRSRLESRGIALAPVSDRWIGEVDRIIFEELAAGNVVRDSQRKLKTLIAELARNKVQAVVLGCTELVLAVDTRANTVPVYDTTAIHSRAAVEWMLSEEEQSRAAA